MRLLVVSLLAALAAPGAAFGARATVAGRAILVDGKPFFPLMTWAQCAPEVEDNLAVGVNLFLGTACDADALASAVHGRAYVAFDYARFAGRDFPGLIGYHQPDEPDASGIPPSALQAPPAGDGRIVFETLSYHFSVAHPALAGVGPAEYAQYAAHADVLGWDLYPQAVFCDNPWIGIANVYDEQRELVVLAAGKPTYEWIETNNLDGRCAAQVGPAEIRAEAWLAVAGGASGIGWFTHGGTGAAATPFSVPSANRAAIVQVGRDLTALTSVLLSPHVDTIAEAPLRSGARAAGGDVWVLAVNPSRARVVASVRVPALAGRDGTASVWGESRSLRVADGQVTDAFAALGTHVYDVHAASPEPQPVPREEREPEPDRWGLHR